MTRYDHVARFRETLNERKAMSELSAEGRQALEWALERAVRAERAAEDRLIGATHDVQRFTDELAEVRRDLEALRGDLGLDA